MEQQKTKRVVILGAGVSYSLDHKVPTQKEFFDKFKRGCRLPKLNKSFPGLKSLYQFFEINQNIEGYFSILHALSRSETSRKQKEALELLISCRREIALWLSKFDHKKDEFIENKFKSRWDKLNTVFISTNYDEIFEHKILGDDVNFYGFLASPNGAWKILKPHGSISWMEIRDLEAETQRIGAHSRSVALSRRPLEYVRVPINSIKKLNKGISITNSLFPYRGEKGTGLTPVFVPFVFQKEDWFLEKWGELLGQIFRKCNDEIKNCDELWIVGYGMPDADWTFAEAFHKLKAEKKKIKVNLVFPHDTDKIETVEDKIKAIEQTKKTIGKFIATFPDGFDYYNQDAKDFFANGRNKKRMIKSINVLEELELNKSHKCG